jgi:hypothetical protein
VIAEPSQSADWLSYIVSDGDKDDVNSHWTSFSSISSDSHRHESASSNEEEGLQTRRTASIPLASGKALIGRSNPEAR